MIGKAIELKMKGQWLKEKIVHVSMCDDPFCMANLCFEKNEQSADWLIGNPGVQVSVIFELNYSSEMENDDIGTDKRVTLNPG